MNRQRRWVIGAVVMAILVTAPFAGGAARGAARAAGPAAAAQDDELTITGPATAVAGDDITVAIDGVPDGSDLTVTTIGSAGTTARAVPVTDGSARLVLDPAITDTAGTVTVLATAGAAAATASVRIEPGAPVDPIIGAVGARSIVADGTDRSMVVALPADRLGNVIAEGSPLDVLRRRPDGAISTQPTAVAHLVAWSLLPSGTTAGVNQIWLQAGDVSGPSTTLDEVAAPPLPFTLEAVDPQLAAATGGDGQSLVPVRTSVLADPHGNIEPDGTQVTFSWDGPTGAGQAQAVTIAGVATTWIPAPTTAATITLTASCRGTAAAAALPLTFDAVLQQVPVTATRTPGVAVAVFVGPVLQADGAFALDGTAVEVTMTDSSTAPVVGWTQLVDGRAKLLLPAEGVQGPVTVQATVLGTTGSTELP